MPTPITITAQTTRDQLLAEFQRCAGYDLDGSAADARQFARCCRALLSPRYPAEAEQGGRGGFNSKLVISVETLQQLLDACLKWLTANDPNFASSLGGGGVVHASNSHGWER